MNRTNIEYLDYSWNPTHGCSPISPGCDHCWARATSKSMARMGARGYSKDDPFRVVCCPWKLDEPLKVKKPSRIGVSFMGDLFHEDVSNEFRFKVFDTIIECVGLHTFLILTKRPQNIQPFLNLIEDWDSSEDYCKDILFGTSIEDQKTADERIPHILNLAVQKRFVSIEPMLGLVDIHHHLTGIRAGLGPGLGVTEYDVPYLDWVIVGAESGQNRRLCKSRWVYAIKDQCYDPGTPLFIKQIHCNGKVSKKMADWPEDLQIQEFPI